MAITMPNNSRPFHGSLNPTTPMAAVMAVVKPLLSTLNRTTEIICRLLVTKTKGHQIHGAGGKHHAEIRGRRLAERWQPNPKYAPGAHRHHPHGADEEHHGFGRGIARDRLADAHGEQGEGDARQAGGGDCQNDR